MGVKYDYLLKRLRTKDDGGTPSGSPSNPIPIDLNAFQLAYTNQTLLSAFYMITNPQDADGGAVIVQVVEDENGRFTPALQGTGIFMNADYQVVGDYSEITAVTGLTFVDNYGQWYDTLNVQTFTYNTLAGGTFTPGEVITQASTGATGIIITDNGATSLTYWNTSAAGVQWDATAFDNGGGISAISEAVGSTDFRGIVVIFDGYHWIVDQVELWNGTDPQNNPAYTFLDKNTAGLGYITEVDSIEYDFANDDIIVRRDKRRNVVYNFGFGLNIYQWGNDSVRNNLSYASKTNIVNQRGTIAGNKFEGKLNFVSDNTHTGKILNNEFDSKQYGTGGPALILTCNMTAAFEFAGNKMSIVTDVTINGTRSSSGYEYGVLGSNFPAQVNITGLTTLDLTVANNYCGDFGYVLSSNPTESITTFANFPPQPGNIKIKFTPEPGLILTFVHGTGANQPRCKGGVNVILNGDNGDFAEFWMDGAADIYQTN